MANIFGFSKQWVVFIIPFGGYFFGKYWDDLERERSTTFRDKSKLFEGLNRDGQPSW